MGNLMPKASSLLHFASCDLGAADAGHQPLRDSQSGCWGFDNLVDSFAAGGSRRAKGSRGGYGPWRQPPPFKLRGGHSDPHSGPESSWASHGAPCSSTSVQTSRGSATDGTPQARLAALLVNLMDDDINRPGSSVLTAGQQALYDICKRDLHGFMVLHVGDPADELLITDSGGL